MHIILGGRYCVIEVRGYMHSPPQSVQLCINTSILLDLSLILLVYQ